MHNDDGGLDISRCKLERRNYARYILLLQNIKRRKKIIITKN